MKGSQLGGGGARVKLLAMPDRRGDVRVDAAVQAEHERFLIDQGESPEKVKLEQRFPGLTIDDRFVFFLTALNGSGGQGGSRQRSASVSYRYVNAVKVEPGAVELVKRYIRLARIEDLEQREQAIVKLAFSLLRDPQTPVRFATDALRDLYHLRVKSAAMRLRDDEIEALVRITADPRQPASVRSWASGLLGGSLAARRRININPLLKMIGDSSDDVNQRLNALYVLEQTDIPEIRAAVRFLLATGPPTEREEDKIVWRALARSPLAKQP